MTGRLRTPTDCDNMNHRRPDAPVGHCPQCGKVVNESLRRSASCNEAAHAAARRRQVDFCVHCGLQLIVYR